MDGLYAPGGTDSEMPPLKGTNRKISRLPLDSGAVRGLHCVFAAKRANKMGRSEVLVEIFLETLCSISFGKHLLLSLLTCYPNIALVGRYLKL